MKKLRYSAVVALIAATLVLPATAEAEMPYQFQVRGLIAWALFLTVDPVDPCIVTETFVAAGQSRVQEAPGRPFPEASAFTRILRLDQCTDEILMVLRGETTPLDLGGSRSLKTASLVTTMTVEDVVSGSVFDVAFDLDWTGVGEATLLTLHLHMQEPGLITNFHNNEATRQGSARGSVSDGTTDFTGGEPATLAEFSWVSNGAVEVSVR